MAWHGMAWQGRAGQGRAWPGLAWHFRAGKDRTGHDRTGQDGREAGVQARGMWMNSAGIGELRYVKRQNNRISDNSHRYVTSHVTVCSQDIRKREISLNSSRLGAHPARHGAPGDTA